MFPSMTYVSWPEKGIKPSDKKLICVYNDPEFLKKEGVLKGHRLFLEDIDLEYPSKAYIFDYRGVKGLPGDYQPNMKDSVKRALMWSQLEEKDKRAYSLEYSMGYNWDMFLLGRYSRLSMSLKKKIKDYYKNNENSYVHIESYLHPQKYYPLYAPLLSERLGMNITVEELKNIGELTDKPQLTPTEDHGSEILISKPIKIKL